MVFYSRIDKSIEIGSIIQKCLLVIYGKNKRSSREKTTPLFLLRCLEIGLSIQDLDYLTIGMVMDIWTEKGNDSVKYDSIATQEDFDKF